ncbi:MAG: PD40 domain-containing protein [Pyrinomonadaceae bacterium]|nr:PD40 domain-containing protein [Sphingobacteriaceae bacterium]
MFLAAALSISVLSPFIAFSQIGKRFPSEKKVVKDPITGTMLTFLTSTPEGDHKIYQTHPQWTSDGQWLIFRSDRARGEAMAVNEKTGDLVQVTEGGYSGMLSIAQKSMKLYFMRNPNRQPEQRPAGGQSPQTGQNSSAAAGSPNAAPNQEERGERNTPASLQIIEVDLAKVFADSKAGKMQAPSVYQRICGTTPVELGAGGDMALDGGEEWVYFRVGRTEAAKYLAADTKLEGTFGPRNMGAGPAGIARMNLKTGEFKHVVSVPFQVGHIQSNPWNAGEVIFCWETGGKSPQRTWIVNADGTGLRPLYPEATYEWVTHEAVISKDEVAIAIMGHRKIPGTTNTGVAAPGTAVSGANPGQETQWGPSGTREKPTGLGIINIRTREMTIAGQTPKGSGLWHVHGSADGKWAVGDDFSRSLYLIDRHTREMIMLTTGHKETASDHPHPTFSPDGTRVQIQSAMLSADNKSMNICIVPVPKAWLKRTY